MLIAAERKTKITESRAATVAALLLDVVPPIMRELRREARRSRGGALTIPQFRILGHLGCQEAATNKSLAESMGVSVAATSRMVDLLQRKGLVERFQDTKDKRQIHLRLSPKGKKDLEGIRRLIRSELESRLKVVPEQGLRQAEAGLLALQDVLPHLYRGFL